MILLHSKILPATILTPEINTFQFPVLCLSEIRIHTPEFGGRNTVAYHIDRQKVGILLLEKHSKSVDLTAGACKQDGSSLFQVLFHLLERISNFRLKVF